MELFMYWLYGFSPSPGFDGVKLSCAVALLSLPALLHRAAGHKRSGAQCPACPVRLLLVGIGLSQFPLVFVVSVAG